MTWPQRRSLTGSCTLPFPNPAIFRIDHYLGKRPVNNVAVFRFANAFVEPSGIEITSKACRSPWRKIRGARARRFLRSDWHDSGRDPKPSLPNSLQSCHGAPRPHRTVKTVRDEKVKVLKAIRPIEPTHLVRGQFRDYRQEKGVAPDSQMETFAALQLEVDSWRWKGVPFYIRAGKNLPVTCTEVIGRLRKPPTVIKDSALSQNHVRFRISPEMTIAIGATVMSPGEAFIGETVEMIASRRPRPEEMEAYERVLATRWRETPSCLPGRITWKKRGASSIRR